jgi:hypothetical protein
MFEITREFLGHLWNQLHPRSWWGPLDEVLQSRKSQVIKLTKHRDEQVRAWAADILPRLDSWIEDEKGRERGREESFE